MQEPWCAYLLEDLLQDLGIVGGTVSLGAVGLDANEVTDAIVLVLGLLPGDDPPGAIQQARCLVWDGEVASSELALGVASMVHITLAP